MVAEGATITYAGSASSAPKTDDATVEEVNVLLPGLWDCHAHLFGSTQWSLEMASFLPPATSGARATADLANYIAGGVTSVREVGGYGVELAPVVDEGSLVGPTIYGAGAVLSTTGGHGDVHAIPLDFYEALGDHGRILGRLCDGPAECTKAVREQLRKNARVIKICASGGVMSEVDHPIHQQFSDEELAAIVSEAARAERVVAAHCHGKPGIMAALRAGVKTIEHGTYLDEEAAELMKEKDAILVATRFVVEELMGLEAELPRLRLAQDLRYGRPARPGAQDRRRHRGQGRDGDRHLYQRTGSWSPLPKSKSRDPPPHRGRNDGAGGDRGSHRSGPRDSRTPRSPIRAACRRIRCRLHRPRPEPPRGLERVGRARSGHRRVEEGRAAQIG